MCRPPMKFLAFGVFPNLIGLVCITTDERKDVHDVKKYNVVLFHLLFVKSSLSSSSSTPVIFFFFKTSVFIQKKKKNIPRILGLCVYIVPYSACNIRTSPSLHHPT